MVLRQGQLSYSSGHRTPRGLLNYSKLTRTDIDTSDPVLLHKVVQFYAPGLLPEQG